MYIILALHTVKIIIISVIYHILVYQKICRNDHMQRALVSQDIIQNISQMTYLSLFHSYISLSRQSRYPNSTTNVQYTKYLAIYSCQVLCSMHTHTSSSFKIQRIMFISSSLQIVLQYRNLSSIIILWSLLQFLTENPCLE